MTDTSHHYVPSPCVRQCTLDDQDVCVGCGRTLDDIRRWSQVTPPEQEAIVAEAEKRLRERRTRWS